MAGVVADRVIVELEAKLDRYNANVVNAQRQFERGMAGMRASAARTEGAVTASFRRMGSVAGTALSAGVLIAGARGFLKLVDSAKQLEAQLKLATTATGDFATAQKDVRAIASATRSDLNAVGTLYANVARNAKDLGITQAEVATVTKNVAQSFLISGSTAVEAAQGVRQLIQGLQSGVLRGDEFNTVMESAPRLARALADSLGVPIGQLRAMAEAGTLTAATLTTALSDPKITAALTAEFDRLPVTFDQAMTLVKNAAQETFSAFDSGGQFSNAIANFVTSGEDGFSDLAVAAEQLGIDIASAMAGLYDAFEPMLSGAMRVFGLIGNQADGLARAIADILGAADSAANAVPKFANRIRQNGRNAGIGFVFGQDSPMTSNLRGNFLQGYQRRKKELTLDSRERAVGRLPGTGASFQRYLNEPDKYDAFGQPLTPHQAITIPGKTKKGKKGPKGPSAETLAARAERARLQQEREDEAYRQDLAKLNEDILAAKASLLTAADAIAEYELQQIESERQRVNASYAAEVVQKKLTEAQAAELTLANDKLAGLKAEAVQLREKNRLRDEAADLAQAEKQADLDVMQAQANLAETRQEQRTVALQILDAQYELLRMELEAVKAAHTAADIEYKIADAKLKRLNTQYAAERAGVEKQHQGPLASYMAGFDATDINDQLEQVQVDGLKGIEDQLTTTIAKVFELGGAFGQVANQIIADLIRIAIQQAITGIISLVTGGAGGGGGAASALTNFVGPRASGGHVVKGKMYRVNEGGGSGDVEGFQPGGSGKIIPLGRMRGAQGGGVTVVQSFTLDARYGITTPELLRHVNEVATERAVQAGKASFDASQRAMPKRFANIQKLGQ